MHRHQRSWSFGKRDRAAAVFVDRRDLAEKNVVLNPD
jgi:hypothetical protein